MEKLPLLREWLISQFKNTVVFAVLYGSHLYGTATTESDYDLYVIVSNDTIEDIIQFDIPIIGHIDICIMSERTFHDNLRENDVKALESIFVLPQYVIIGNQMIYQQKFVCYHPFLRNTFGKVCRNSWDRGVKKLTKETDPHEIKLGKKSLYHAIRLFICANQLYMTGRISFNDPRLQEAKNFYLGIRDKNVSELVENCKLKQEYLDLYKQYDKEFRQIPNEEQYSQLMRKRGN